MCLYRNCCPYKNRRRRRQVYHSDCIHRPRSGWSKNALSNLSAPSILLELTVQTAHFLAFPEFSSLGRSSLGAIARLDLACRVTLYDCGHFLASEEVVVRDQREHGFCYALDALAALFGAATARLELQFSMLTIVDHVELIERKRVSCYELYHRLRLAWTRRVCRYTLIF